jgi:hypothetical protein
MKFFACGNLTLAVGVPFRNDNSRIENFASRWKPYFRPGRRPLGAVRTIPPKAFPSQTWFWGRNLPRGIPRGGLWLGDAYRDEMNPKPRACWEPLAGRMRPGGSI